MKKHLNLLFLIFVLHNAMAQNCGCNHNITKSGVINASSFTYKPGDVFCIQAGKHGFFRFIGFQGTKEKPLIFKNCGGRVIIDGAPYVGIQFRGSKHVIISGSGATAHEYGIKINSSPASGVSISDLSTDFEVHHLEITGTGFAGIIAKTDPTCTDSSGFKGKFVLENLNLHHNYIHDNLDGEGFYIGYTGNYDKGKTVNCGDGVTKVLFGHAVKHVKIHHNILINVAWDAIQVALVDEGLEIYENYVENAGVVNEPVQNMGIQLGSGTVGRVYKNTVIGGTNHGISNFGLGPVYIYNNLIVRSAARGIYNDHQQSPPPANGYYIANNTIVNPKQHGIFYNNGANQLDGPFECYNNLIVNPGIYNQIANLTSHWSKADIHAYIGFNTKDSYDKAAADLRNNIFTRNLNYPKFIDRANDNYALDHGSPAIDKGTNDVIAIFGYDDDLTGFKRKGIYDVGAIEYENPVGLSTFETDSKYLSVFPNPVSSNDKCSVKLKDINADKYTITLIPLDGKDAIVLFDGLSLDSGDNELTMNPGDYNLGKGIYLLKATADSFVQILKLQIN